MSDKYSEILIENDYKLTDQHYLELSKDKRIIEQEVANKKHNVALLAYAKNQLTGPNAGMWEPESLDRYTAFVDEGNAGNDASQILVPQFNMPSYLNELSKEIEIESSDETFEFTPSGDKKIITETDEPYVRAEYGERWDSDPKIQYERQKAAKRGDKALEEFDSLKEMWIESNIKRNISEKSLSASDIKQREAKAVPTHIKELIEKHPNLGRIPEEDVDAAQYYY